MSASALADRNNMSAMGCSHVVRHRAAATAAILTLLATTAFWLVAGPAHAEQAVSSQPTSPLTLSVTSVTPSYATTGGKITISGTVHNDTSSALSGLAMQLSFSATPMSSITQLQQYVNGSYQPGGQPVLANPHVIGSLSPGQSATWSIPVKVSSLGLSCFGVYPLTTQVTDSAGASATDPVPLPYWPKNAHGCATSRPKPSVISWIWPLIDTPHQGACPGLLDNYLAGSLKPAGRLGRLLRIGAQYAATDNLTWAIDPALLDNVNTMTSPYSVGSRAECDGAKQYQADPGATRWLARLNTATAGHTVFVTPYADVDVAALTRLGIDLGPAFTDGARRAGKLLSRDRVPASLPAGPHKLAAVAWPADGIAGPAVLQNLAALNIRTVILDMPTQFPATSTAVSGQITTESGIKLDSLLGNIALNQLLRSSQAASRNPGTIFGISQAFLAETALFASAAPSGQSGQRAILVTPPRRWDPAAKLASALLTNTHSAPWLTQSAIDHLVSLPKGLTYQPVTRLHPKDELPGKLLRKVSALDRKIAVLKSILVNPQPQLDRAVFGIESSAWRSGETRHARAMLQRILQYVSAQFNKLSVVGPGGGVRHVTLGGTVADVKVSIRNGLSYPVRLTLGVSSSNKSVTADQPKPMVVQANTVGLVKFTVHASPTGTALLQLSLESPQRVVLPVHVQRIQIKATDFGTVALVVFALALAVFVLASAGRAIRRGRPETPSGAPGVPAGPRPEGSAPEGSAHRDSPPRGSPPVADASWPGSRDSLTGLEEPDNVELDRSELTPAGPVTSEVRPITPGRPVPKESL